jgi:signal transduction histidine kinase
VLDSCGKRWTGETPQGFSPRRLTASPAESEHLERKSTTTRYIKKQQCYEDSFINRTQTTTFLKVNFMSIRKRLFLSNVAMVLMPLVMFILYFILLNVLFSEDMTFLRNNYHRGWEAQPAEQENQLFTQLKKTASLESEKLSNQTFLDSITNELKEEHAGVIIRKEDKLLYTSNRLKDMTYDELPPFGNEGYSPVAWFGHQQFEVRQHDFFFKDGAEGSIFLLNEGVPFTQNARTFFPMIAFGLVLILVLTNATLTYFMSRRILKPVNQLSAAASKIREGDLDFKMEPASKDELGKLVITFDEMRRKLKEASEIREQYEKNRRELIANISHDLKTPITSIRGYVEGIKDGVANTEDKLERYLDTIHTKAEHMNRLIDELFLYSKLDVKSLPFRFEEVELKAFLEDYLEELRLELREVNVQIHMQKIERFRPTVMIDRDKMIRVMDNIIYNSVKYMDKDRCHIHISLEEKEEMVEVKIGDNGPGVPEKELSSIFNRFHRSDPSRNSNSVGSGLGLAIAAQIIKAHSGKIWAESAPGNGLSIHFTLQLFDDEVDRR